MAVLGFAGGGCSKLVRGLRVAHSARAGPVVGAGRRGSGGRREVMPTADGRPGIGAGSGPRGWVSVGPVWL